MRAEEKALESETEAIAEACFSHLVQNPEDLQRFMAESGYTPQSIEKALGTPGLGMGMIEYFVRSEPLLLAMCANAGLRPERVTKVWQRLNRRD
ncbi:MAG: DUF3572 family protein [Alphaproteobacteria bacterium]|nr:DUF3572 family protein [Alphaproteobacteria bacterium]